MSTAEGRGRPVTSRPRADAATRAARRKARAADSRRRALLGDSAPVVDGSLAVQPAVEPVAEPKQPDKASRPSRRTVAPPEPVETARAPFVLSILVLLSAGIVGLLVLNTAINKNAFLLQDLRGQQTALDSKEQRLSEELSKLESPGNLAAAADRLGLVRADDITHLRLPDGKELKMPTPGGS